MSYEDSRPNRAPRRSHHIKEKKTAGAAERGCSYLLPNPVAWPAGNGRRRGVWCVLKRQRTTQRQSTQVHVLIRGNLRQLLHHRLDQLGEGALVRRVELR